MQNSNKKKILLNVLLISMIILIPSLLISIQRDINIPIEERKPKEIINTQPPHESSVYYEDVTGSVRGAYVSGDYAYVASFYSGLAVIDISDPTDPETLVYEATTGWAYNIYVSGDYAYLANGDSGLAIINISDPTNLGTPVYKDTTGSARGIYVSGNYAYIANGWTGLAIIDISNPINPGVPVYEYTNMAYDVYVSGDYAYVADGNSGLAVIDISNPTNPGIPVYENTTGSARSVYVSGDYAYLTDSESGLAVIDISDPTNPGAPVYEATTGNAYDIYVSGDYAYVADSHSGLAVIDISDPANPGAPIYEDTTGSTIGVYVSGDYAYMGDSVSFAVIKISEPINPGTPIYKATTGYAEGVYVSGDYVYVADTLSGLAVIDISDPTDPGTPIYEDTTGNAFKVYVSGDYIYVANTLSGLAVIDISDPTNPGPLVYETTTGWAECVYVSGDYAYVADGGSGLAVIGISDPTNPGTPVYEDTTGYAYDIYISGDYAYIADGDFGLAVVNISDPTNPGTPVYEDTTGSARGVYVSGDYAYIADYSQGLAVINISDPTNPGTPVYEDTTGQALDVYISGDYAYVADGVSGLAVIDISDPTNPGTPIYGNTASSANSIYVNGDYAYIANGNSGLAVIQIRNMLEKEAPIISNAPSDFTVEAGYTGESLSWTATDANPDNYTIELLGTGIVVSSTHWTNNVPVVYNIPDGFSVGSYIYTITFTDDFSNLITDIVNLTVEDTINPVIIVSPNNFTVETGYTGQSISWTATDENPDIYTIELKGTGLVIGPTIWTSGNAINYNIPDGFSVGSYIYTVAFTDDYSNFITDSVNFTVEDTNNPVLTVSPINFTVEAGYTGQSLSWTATDANPDTYTIELLGMGIVAGPTVWTSGNAINYNIPNGFSVGSYIYTITFTDLGANFIINSVNFTVEEDTTNPIVTPLTANHTVEAGYIGALLWWTATDANPDTYTVELLGTGLVASPTAWTSGNAINYSIPTGLGAGSYIYRVNFTDNSGNFATDDINFTVIDTSNPFITVSPFDSNVEEGYSGQSLSWTVLDFTPNTYTIELQGTGIVVTPTLWISNTPIIYNIPGGFTIGSYVYTITFTDDSGNFVIDTVNFTVEDTTDPIITSTPSDLTIEFGYNSQFLQWTATDLNPYNYTVELQGTGIVAGPTSWTSGGLITYNIPDGFGVGFYTYTVNFTDAYGNSIIDIVIFTVEDTTSPTVTSAPADLSLEVGYTGEGLSWTATDALPDYYEIELQGSGTVAGALPWTSGDPITYNIPDSLPAGVYVYSVTFRDEHGYSVSDSVTVTINEESTPPPAPGGVPFGNFYLLILGISIICLIIIKKRQIIHRSNR